MFPETVRFWAPAVDDFTGSAWSLESVPDLTRLRVVIDFIRGTSTPESVIDGICRGLLAGACGGSALGTRLIGAPPASPIMTSSSWAPPPLPTGVSTSRTCWPFPFAAINLANNPPPFRWLFSVRPGLKRSWEGVKIPFEEAFAGGDSGKAVDADNNADISGVILKTLEGRTTAPAIR